MLDVLNMYNLEIRSVMGSSILLTLGVMLLVGYFLGKLVAKVGLPEITGFILAGLFVGESVLGLVPMHMTASMKIITDVALGLIALTIGSEFSLTKLRRMGKAVFSLTIVQLLLTFTLVFVALFLAGLPTPFALILASIATASSPAVIVAVVQSLRAHGTFIDYLYSVVALLDAGTVVLFGIAFSFAAGLLGLSSGGAGPVSLFFSALGELVFSLLAGVAMGLILHYAVRKKTRNNEILIITLGLAFVFTAMAIIFHLSPLLINMAAGAILINLTPRHHRLFRILEPLTPPLYALFFVLAGSELSLSILGQRQVLILGSAYIVSRTFAKYVGSVIGAGLGKAPAPIKKYLGLCMFPQAGVSLGLVLFVQASPISSAMNAEQLALTGTLVNIVLLSVFINQIFGPPLAKFAILKGISEEE